MTYRLHVFMCENRRADGQPCCAQHNAAAKIKFLRQWLKKRGMHGRGKIRINRAGCMDQCQHGPILVVYPDAVWYRYNNENDLAEIAQQHLLNGKIVHRLRLPPTPTQPPPTPTQPPPTPDAPDNKPAQ